MFRLDFELAVYKKEGAANTISIITAPVSAGRESTCTGLHKARMEAKRHSPRHKLSAVCEAWCEVG